MIIYAAPAVLCAGLFAGAALYINVVEHPTRMSCGTKFAVTEFVPSYKRAAWMQGLLAALGSLGAIAAWLFGAPAIWLAGGLLFAFVIPFTVLVVLPTNKQLLDPALDKDSKLADILLRRWARLHAIRSGLF